MRVLILGASSKRSIGFCVGEYLKKRGHSIVYASRSGKLGVSCDSTKPKSVRALIAKVKPSAVILGAGVFSPAHLGKIYSWRTIREHVEVKSTGALVVANAFLGVRSISKFFIVLGGRELSSDPTFIAFTLGNGALWALVRFLNLHTSLLAYYIDMPTIEGSAMAKKYNSKNRNTMNGAVSADVVASTIATLLDRKVRGNARVLIGESENPRP